MYKHNDLTGKVFGKLTVISEDGRTADRCIRWKCLCECGNEVSTSGRSLTSGHTRSCGCLQKETTSALRRIHGDRDARLYAVWKGMKRRCENKTDNSYQWYGAKGVSVCEEWHDYAAFRAWAIANGYDENAEYGKCTIDRIDPCGNYEPSNCRWVSMAEQNRNKRRENG